MATEQGATPETNGLCRPVVRGFANGMELRLRDNDHKTGWLDMDILELIDMLEAEVDELKEEIRLVTCGAVENDLSPIRHEAIDVANFAMMIWDICGPKVGVSRCER